MSIRKNTWDLDGHYDLTNSGLNEYFDAQDRLFAWGSNTNGQLGQNDRVSLSSPVQIPGSEWNEVQVGNEFVLASKTNGTLWVWGNNSFGRLGLNNLTHYSSPTQIPGTQWNSFDVPQLAPDYALASKTDGTLWIWGRNTNGQLGQNNVTDYSSPTQIPGTQWSQVSCAALAGAALKTDNTLWIWGYNSSGALGQNNTIQYSSPRQIPGTQWSKVARGYLETIASKTDGTLWSWGQNAYGQLGHSNLTSYSSPRQIPGTQWTNEFASSSYSFMAIKDDGTLWTWGINQQGALGHNTATYAHSSPVQIPGTQWSRVSNDGPRSSAGAFKTDNTLWVWGYNSNGQIGVNDTIARSSPVQVPGSWWEMSGANSVLAVTSA